jgi:hypothetical protein
MKKIKGFLLLSLLCLFTFCSSNVKDQIDIVKIQHRKYLTLDCIESFWGYDISKRGNMFVFCDKYHRILTHFRRDKLFIDTVIMDNRQFDSFINLRNYNIIELNRIARCFQSMDAISLRGFNVNNIRILEIYVNDFIVMYYIPEIKTSDKRLKISIKQKTIKIDENWYYIIKKNKYSPTIW